MERGKVALLEKPFGDFQINTHELPKAEGTSVILKVELCGICGTDVHIYQGKHHGITFPIVLGHEITGTVHALGSDSATDYLGKPIKKGDRVILTPAMFCGKCFFCSVAKTPVRCVDSTQYGFFSENIAPSPFNGGYGQYLAIDTKTTDFFRTAITAEAGLFAEPLAVSFHTVMRAGIKPGDTVVVQGAGSLGLLHILAAKAAGAGKIIMVTRRKTKKLDVARELGADVTISIEEIPDAEERIRRVREESLSGYGADAVLECVGVPSVIPEGLAYTRDSGVYCIVGHAVDEGTVPINPADIMERNLRIEGVFDHSVEDFYKAVSLLEREGSAVEKILTHKIPFSRLAEGFNSLVKRTPFDNTEIAKAAVDPWA